MVMETSLRLRGADSTAAGQRQRGAESTPGQRQRGGNSNSTQRQRAADSAAAVQPGLRIHAKQKLPLAPNVLLQARAGGDRHGRQEAQPPGPPRAALLPAGVGQRGGRSPAGERKRVQVQPPREEGRLPHPRRPPRAQRQRPPLRRQGLQAEGEEWRRRTGLDDTRLQKGSGCQAQSRLRALPKDALFPAEGKQLDS